MHYSRTWRLSNPGCVMFILDQSAGNIGSDAVTPCHLGLLADLANEAIQRLGCLCVKGMEIVPRIEISVIGYGNDVRSLLVGPLAGRDFVTIAELMSNPTRVRNRKKSIRLESRDESQEIEVEFPIWVEPKSEGGRPISDALRHAARLAISWVSSHPYSYPPVVVHLTDGRPATHGADVELNAKQLCMIETDDGQVLLWNCVVAPGMDPNEFIAAPSGLPEGIAEWVFQTASRIPEPIREDLDVYHGIRTTPESRLCSINSLRWLDHIAWVGARPARLPGHGR